MFRFFRWLFGFKKQLAKEIPVGTEVEVYSEEDAIKKAISMCLQSGKMIIGNIDWNEKGVGKMTVTQVQDPPKE